MIPTRTPRVAVVGTGGTIAFHGHSPLDLYEYLDTGSMAAIDQLTNTILDMTTEFDLVPIRFGELASDAIGPKHWLELNDFVNRVVNEQAPLDGIVITHGTSTIEETAYFLNLVSKTDLPIVLVGAQRPWNALCSDGALNLLNAIRVAASPAVHGLGVTVVHDNAIWAARDVTKAATTSSLPFRSPESGMLGYVDVDARVVLYRVPTRRRAPGTAFDVGGLTALPRVDIAYSYAGADGAAIRAFVDSGARGIVVAGLAPGSAAAMQEASIDEARQKGVMMALSMRAGGGRVLERASLRERGIIVADNLRPPKARILLMLGLTILQNVAELQDLFYEY